MFTVKPHIELIKSHMHRQHKFATAANDRLLLPSHCLCLRFSLFSLSLSVLTSLSLSLSTFSLSLFSLSLSVFSPFCLFVSLLSLFVSLSLSLSLYLSILSPFSVHSLSMSIAALFFHFCPRPAWMCSFSLLALFFLFSVICPWMGSVRSSSSLFLSYLFPLLPLPESLPSHCASCCVSLNLVLMLRVFVFDWSGSLDWEQTWCDRPRKAQAQPEHSPIKTKSLQLRLAS